MHVEGRQRTRGKSHNLIATLELPAPARGGDALSAPPISLAVSTPTSGWFNCGGERGPGIAVFLSLVSWLPKYVRHVQV